MRTIFVFGSNTEGRHGKGAALRAKEKYGAIYGCSRGLHGDSYAIITKDLKLGTRSIPLSTIEKDVHEFIDFAREHQDWKFLISAIGCGLAGYTPVEIAPMFLSGYYLPNIDLPEEFIEVIAAMPAIAVTGHRPNKLGNEYDYEGPYSDWILETFYKVIDTHRPKLGITGMALGVDTLWALACIIKKIPFIAAIPFEGQECKWNDEAKDLYNKILNHPLCVQKVYVCDPGYAAWKMQKRNTWMIDKSDLLISIWDESLGGTANCCIFADKVGRRRINFNPKEVLNKI